MFDSLVHIVGVGMEKCGTTSFNDYLAASRAVATPTPKECYFFSKHHERGAQWYADCYRLTGREQAILDFTPEYFRFDDGLARIQGFDSDKKLLLFMRNPVRRAFSHYIHTIYHRVAWGRGAAAQFERPLAFSFLESYRRRNLHYFFHYHDCAQRLIERFGRDRVRFIALERLLADLPGHLRMLQSFLEIDLSDLEGVPFPHANQLSLPRFVLGGDRQRLEGPLAEVPLDPGHLYLLQDGLVARRFGSLPPRRIENALRIEASWTRGLSRAECERIGTEFFADDISQMEELMGVELPEWRRQDDIAAVRLDPLSAEAGLFNAANLDDAAARQLADRGLMTGANLDLEDGTPYDGRFDSFARHLSALLRREGLAGPALAAARRAVAKAPRRVEYSRHLARLLVDEGKLEEAASVLGGVLESGSARRDLAWIACRRGRVLDALRVLLPGTARRRVGAAEGEP